MKGNKIFNDFELYLTKSFATKKEEWEKYVNLLAYEFLNSYYDNLDFINEQSQIINSKEKEKNIISSNEKIKFKLISSIFDLFNMIEINLKEKKIFVNIDEIDESFNKITDSKQQLDIKRNLKELNFAFENQEHVDLKKDSFSDLNRNYNFLIAYIKDEKIREAFFKEFLLQDQKVDVSLLTKNNLYSVNTI